MMRLASLIAVVTLATFAWVAVGQTAPQAGPAQQPADSVPAEPEQPFVVRGGVDLVSVSVTVTDDRGRMIPDLKEDDFVILEDRRQQRIANFRSIKDPDPIPIGLGLLVDSSGSMSSDRLQSMRTVVEMLIKNRLKKQDEVYLMEFAASPVLLQPWTTDRNAILNHVRRLKTKPGTSIYDAIAAALPISAAGTAKKQVMVVFTDGGDTSSTVNRTQLSELARASEVLLYAVVMDGEVTLGSRGANASLRQATAELNQIAAPTGGKALYVEGFQELEANVSKLGQEFVQQYFIEYARDGEKDGKYHEILVGVKRPNVVVRHRRGYVAD